MPAGKYAKAALEYLGIWPSVADRLAQAENVRAALALVSRKEAAAGIVYKTDAAADKEVSVVGTFPEEIASSDRLPDRARQSGLERQRRRAPRVLKSDKAKAIFEAQGFTVTK